MYKPSHQYKRFILPNCHHQNSVGLGGGMYAYQFLRKFKNDYLPLSLSLYVLNQVNLMMWLNTSVVSCLADFSRILEWYHPLYGHCSTSYKELSYISPAQQYLNWFKYEYVYVICKHAIIGVSWDPSSPAWRSLVDLEELDISTPGLARV